MLISGEDELMLVDEAERDPVLAQHVIPDARLVTVPAAGHMVLIEHPEVGSPAITAFIKEVEAH